MKIIKDIDALKDAVAEWKLNHPKKKLGFTPTMGALHEGHISLINKAKETCDFIIASIFVNPTQFNDPKDLKKYPRTEQADAELLKKNGCDILFLPTVKDMYPIGEKSYQIDLNGLDLVMEGKYRPGHFEGVCNIVEKLLRIAAPHQAFFGIKDFQQVAIIKYMVKLTQLPVEIVTVKIKRADSGLAMSSRNMLLSKKEKENARLLNWVLKLGKQLVLEGKSLTIVHENMLSLFNTGQLKLEYLEIVDNTTLQSVKKTQPNITACIVAYCGEVRLIDNIQLN